MIYLAFGYILGHIIFLFLIYVFKIKIKSSITLRVLAFFHCLAMIYIAYYTVPYEGWDLDRYFQLIDGMRKKSLEWCITKSPYRVEMFSNLLMIFTAKSSTNNHYFPAIIVGLIYYTNYKIISLYCDDNEKRGVILYEVLFYSLIDIINIVSGLRHPLGTILFAYAFLLECKKGKCTFYNIALYFFAVCAHSSLWIYICIRIMTAFLEKVKLEKLNIILLFWGMLTNLSVVLLEKSSNYFFQHYAYKIQYYTMNNPEFMAKRQYVFIAYIVTLLIAVMHFYGKRFTKESTDKYSCFIKTILIFLLGGISYATIFGRGVVLAIMISLPLLIYMKKNNKGKIFSFVLLILSMVMLIYQILRIQQAFPFQ